MSTNFSSLNYATKVMEVLAPADGATARTALRIADSLLEHKITCDAIAGSLEQAETQVGLSEPHTVCEPLPVQSN